MSPLVSTFAGAALRPYGFTLGGAAPAAFELISSQVLSSTAANVVFSSIPSNYKHLQLRVVSKVTTGTGGLSGLGIQFNSDTASNYNNHYLAGTGASVISGALTNFSYAYCGYSTDNTTSGNYSGFISDILDYSSTSKYKTIQTFNGIVETSTNNSYVQIFSSGWRSNSAITSIKVYDDGSKSFAIGSRFSLYGVKGV